jgi:competence protein ComEA
MRHQEIDVGVPRPAPARSYVDEFVDRFAGIESGRFIAVGIAALGVVIAGSWLLRSEPAPVEATLETVPVAVDVTLPASVTSPPSEILVHVAGAVRRPGVVAVGAGTRVGDAIAAAGGSIEGSDPDALNLAAVVGDGQRIYVPLVGEMVLSVGDGAGAVTGPIDLNSADASLLESLPGIGPATAAAIVDDRAKNGRFSTVDDLDRVSGIGPATIERLRNEVVAR